MRWLLSWMLFAAPAVAQEASPLPPPPAVTHLDALSTPLQPADAAGSARAAMRDDGQERLTVAVRLGSSRDYHFLVDTGSNRTTVSSELARELGLREEAGAVLHSSSGAAMVPMAFLPELRISRRTVRNIRAPLLSARHIGADGILGIDSLRAQRVTFDFRAGTLAVLTGDDPALDDKDAIVVRAKRRDGRLVIADADIDGQHVTVVLDTGSTLTVGNSALRRRLERGGTLSHLGPIDLVSVMGKAVRADFAEVRALDIGGARLARLGVAFADVHTFALLGLDRKPAMLLGMNAFKGFDQVSIDFADKTLSLVVPKGRGRPPA